MTRTTRSGTTLERLAHHLFDGDAEDAVAEELARWLAGSSRFRTFAEAHRDKIRKKLRGAADGDARRDVRAELAVAHALLADRRFELEFEAYGSGKQGPDFTVTLRGERTFNLEVTRPRRAADPAVVGGSLLAKLRQLPPSAPNVVVLAFEGGLAGDIDIAATTSDLRSRTVARDDAFFSRSGFNGARGFHRRYLRLGGVLAWCEAAADSDDRAAWWANPSARIAVPERAARACLSCLRS